MEDNSINDLLLVKYYNKVNDKIPYIILFYGCNEIEKIRTYPKTQKLINHNKETQEIFQITNLLSTGNKFEGSSYLKISLFGPHDLEQDFNCSYSSIHHLFDYKVPLRGDIIKLECLNKCIKAEEACRIGSILSNGEFLMHEFLPKDLLDIYFD